MSNRTNETHTYSHNNYVALNMFMYVDYSISGIEKSGSKKLTYQELPLRPLRQKARLIKVIYCGKGTRLKKLYLKVL
jgi:hypothetical protein